MAAARVAFVLSFERKVVDGVPVAEVKVDAGDGDTTLHDHWQPAGEDSQPCVGDAVLLVDSATGSGEEEIVGYADVQHAGTAAAGEKQLYARDASRNVKVVLHLKADGSCVVSNDAGSLTLEADGSVTITGDLNVNGEVTAKAGIPASAVSLSTHLHGTATDGPTTAPTPGT